MDECKPLLRGASSHVLMEAERSIHDALCVLAGAYTRPFLSST